MINCVSVLFLYHDAHVRMSLILTYNKFQPGFSNFDKPVFYLIKVCLATLRWSVINKKKHLKMRHYICAKLD